MPDGVLFPPGDFDYPSGWSTARPDWFDRLKARQSMLPDLPVLNQEAADKALRIFRNLRIPDVPGQPRIGDAGAEWFEDIVRVIFGSLCPETKARAIRELFCLVPKKNGKTTYAAALMLTAVLMNERPRASFLMVGPTVEAANLAFSQALGMIQLDPFLGQPGVFHYQEHKRTLTFLKTKATLVIKSFDPKTLTGTKAAGILVDEEHVVAEVTNGDRAMGQLRGGMMSQPEAFMVVITTQSERPPKGVFKQDLEKARDVRDGKRYEPYFLPLLYELPAFMQKPKDNHDGSAAEVDAWRDPAIWHWLHPNLGRGFTLGRLIQEYKDAESKGLEEFIRWCSQHLNIEVGLALMSEHWAGAPYWQAAGDEECTLEAILEMSEAVVIGVDGGGLDDLLAICVMGRDADTKDWLHWSHAWLYRPAMERRKDQIPKYMDLQKAGELTIFDLMGEDVDGLMEIVERIEDTGLLAVIGLDPAGVGQIVDRLAELGIEDDRVKGVSQGWTLTGAIKTLERKVTDHSFVHGRQLLMQWAVGNARQEAKGNAISITKQISGSAKIDPFMATLNAVVLLSKNPTPPDNSDRLFERGVISI